MEKLVALGILFDYYGKLLTNKQYTMIDQHYNEDLSLTEIAQINNISKQAVSENLKRAEKKLYEYEKKLELIKRQSKNYEFIKDIDKKLDKIIKNSYCNKDKDSLLNLRKDINNFFNENLEDVIQ